MQNLSLFRLPPKFRGRSAFIVQLWWIIQALLFNTSPQFLYSYRCWLLRIFGAKIGKNVLIRPSVKITFPWKLTIGNSAWIGDEVVLYTLGDIYIGDNSVISQRSYLCAADHDYTEISFPIRAKPIRIEKEVWVATDVFVGPSVHLGVGCVIAARSSVFKDMPNSFVCMGNPCKPLKPRF